MLTEFRHLMQGCTCQRFYMLGQKGCRFQIFIIFSSCSLHRSEPSRTEPERQPGQRTQRHTRITSAATEPPLTQTETNRDEKAARTTDAAAHPNCRTATDTDPASTEQKNPKTTTPCQLSFVWRSDTAPLDSWNVACRRVFF